MSTRKLILAALACGLAILIAGGVMLLRLSTTDTKATTLAEGTTATVSGTTVAVVSHAVDGTTLRLTVSAPTEKGWGVITDTGTPVPPLTASCTAGQCTLDFDLSKIKRTPKSYVAGFSAGGQSASWSLKTA